jgi:hypothetical protein
MSKYTCVTSHTAALQGQREMFRDTTSDPSIDYALRVTGTRIVEFGQSRVQLAVKVYSILIFGYEE